MDTPVPDPEILLNALMSDIFNIIGIRTRSILGRPIGLITRPALWRFCSFFAETDRIMARDGFSAGAKWLLLNAFARNFHIRGAENVPPHGPVLVVSNHPGGFDSVAISASLGRDDLKIISSDVPFLKRLPVIGQHLIIVSDDANIRMNAIRQSIRHLQAGGALLVFPTGLIDPEPAGMAGSEEVMKTWSNSVELFLRKVPDALLVQVLASNVLLPRFIHHPLTRLQSLRWKKQRMAEFLQISAQMLSSGKILLEPRLSFSQTITKNELEQLYSGCSLREAVIQREINLLAEHRAAFAL